MLCRDGDPVSKGDKSQDANPACWRELHCDRESGLFADQLRDGNRLRNDRAQESGRSRPVARGPEKVNSACLCTKRVDTDRQLRLDIGICRPILNRDVSNFFKGSYGHYRLSIQAPLAFDFSR